MDASEPHADNRLLPPFAAYLGDTPYLFVSYAHKDSASVYPEILRLHEQGYRIWYDEGIEPGKEWPEAVGRALETCSLFLVFVSPNAVDSSNVRNEINLAINRRKPFVAVHIEETNLPIGLELRMGDLQAILRYRHPEERYQALLERALPATLLEPQDLSDATYAARPALVEEIEPGRAQVSPSASQQSSVPQDAPAPESARFASSTTPVAAHRKAPLKISCSITVVTAVTVLMMGLFNFGRSGVTRPHVVTHESPPPPTSESPEKRLLTKLRGLETDDQFAITNGSDGNTVEAGARDDAFVQTDRPLTQPEQEKLFRDITLKSLKKAYKARLTPQEYDEAFKTKYSWEDYKMILGSDWLARIYHATETGYVDKVSKLEPIAVRKHWKASGPNHTSDK